MREPGVLGDLAGDRFTVLVVIVFGALGAVVAGVGAVAMAAEFGNTWSYYFLFEQSVALATPVATALLLAALAVGVLAVARS